MDFAPHRRYAEVLRGEVAATRAERPRMPPVWGHAFDMLLWHVEPERSTRPSIAEARALIGSDSAEPLAILAQEGLRAAVLDFDLAEATRWHSLLRDLVEISTGSTRDHAGVMASIGAAWLAWFGGSFDPDGVATVQQRAAALRSAPLVVEAAALWSLHAIETVDPERAVEVTRRAARIARTEAMPQFEYLASLSLARVRRRLGKPHLTTRIVCSLLRVCPSQWHGWLRWELTMAGGQVPPDTQVRRRNDAPLSNAADSLDRLVEAYRVGDRSLAAQHHSELTAVMLRGVPFARDVQLIRDTTDPAVPPERSHPVAREWIRGEQDAPPAEILGLGSVAAEGGDQTTAWVVAHPERQARRIFALGAALAERPPVMDPKRSRPGRVETTIAALALAGDAGIERTDLFRTVYGFDYVAKLHKATFKVLRHRVRTQLGSHGELRVADDQVALVVFEPFRVADPRCVQPLSDLVLRVLARTGGGSAKSAATSLGVSLRTAQQALQELVEDGVCHQQRRGRSVEYRVEDTTFSSPSVRLDPPDQS